MGEIALFKTFEGTALMNQCRDIVLLQYYCGGIRISDALTLKVEQITDGKINIQIRKTGTQLYHNLPDSALSIVNIYREGKQAGEYLFDFIPNELEESDPQKLNKQISSATTLINKNIKLITKQLSIPKKISTHSFRHSFAINALQKGIPLEQIQVILKHSNIRETQIYARIQNEEINNTMRQFDK